MILTLKIILSIIIFLVVLVGVFEYEYKKLNNLIFLSVMGMASFIASMVWL